MTTQHDKYSLLLMRDDGRVKRIRLTRTSLRLVIVAAILLPLLTAGSLWLGFTSWRHHATLVAENLTLGQELKAARVAVERLGNLEKILQKQDPEQLQTLLGNISIRQQAENRPAPPSAIAPQPSPADNLEATIPADAGADNGPDIAEAEAAPNIAAVSTGAAKIDNVSARLLPDGKVRVTLDLTNADPKHQLLGTVNLALLAPDNTSVSLAPPQDSVDFRISKFKKVVATAPLPETLRADQVRTLVVEVIADSKTIFRDTFVVQGK